MGKTKQDSVLIENVFMYHTYGELSIMNPFVTIKCFVSLYTNVAVND